MKESPDGARWKPVSLDEDLKGSFSKKVDVGATGSPRDGEGSVKYSEVTREAYVVTKPAIRYRVIQARTRRKHCTARQEHDQLETLAAKHALPPEKVESIARELSGMAVEIESQPSSATPKSSR